jgi:hypothetical protein
MLIDPSNTKVPAGSRSVPVIAELGVVVVLQRHPVDLDRPAAELA